MNSKHLDLSFGLNMLAVHPRTGSVVIRAVNGFTAIVQA
jgi:hypothetical protein